MGEALIDIVQRPGEDAVEYPGGSPLNVAVALGRLGHISHLLTQIGDDARGDAIREHVHASGVQLTAGSMQERSTSTALAQIDDTGAASYTFDLLWAPDPAGLPALADAIHTSSIAAVLEPGAETLRDIIIRMRPVSLISYDPNIRPALMGTPEQVLPIVHANAQLADIVKASDEDVQWLLSAGEQDETAISDPVGGTDADATGASDGQRAAPGSSTDPIAAFAEDLLARGAALVVITRGGDGASAFTAAGRVDIPSEHVDVADTVGAGDTFSAGLIDGLARLGLLGAEHRDAIRALDLEQVEALVRHAAQLAAVTVSRPGANPPWESEITDTLTAAGPA